MHLDHAEACVEAACRFFIETHNEVYSSYVARCKKREDVQHQRRAYAFAAMVWGDREVFDEAGFPALDETGYSAGARQSRDAKGGIEIRMAGEISVSVLKRSNQAGKSQIQGRMR